MNFAFDSIEIANGVHRVSNAFEFSIIVFVEIDKLFSEILGPQTTILDSFFSRARLKKPVFDTGFVCNQNAFEHEDYVIFHCIIFSNSIEMNSGYR